MLILSRTFNSILTALRSFAGIRICVPSKILGMLNSIYRRPLRSIRGYIKAHYYLGTLYSWRAFREEVDRELAGEYEQKAQGKYELLTSPQQSDETQALGHFGLGLLAYRHYRREQRLNPRQPETASLADPTLEKADRHFTEAIDLDSTLYFARTGRARVYKAQGCIEQAIREFQQARQRAKDQSSQSWIDEQIEALKASPRRPPSTSASRPLCVV